LNIVNHSWLREEERFLSSYKRLRARYSSLDIYIYSHVLIYILIKRRDAENKMRETSCIRFITVLKTDGKESVSKLGMFL